MDKDNQDFQQWFDALKKHKIYTSTLKLSKEKITEHLFYFIWINEQINSWYKKDAQESKSGYLNYEKIRDIYSREKGSGGLSALLGAYKSEASDDDILAEIENALSIKSSRDSRLFLYRHIANNGRHDLADSNQDVVNKAVAAYLSTADYNNQDKSQNGILSFLNKETSATKLIDTLQNPNGGKYSKVKFESMVKKARAEWIKLSGNKQPK